MGITNLSHYFLLVLIMKRNVLEWHNHGVHFPLCKVKLFSRFGNGDGGSFKKFQHFLFLQRVAWQQQEDDFVLGIWEKISYNLDNFAECYHSHSLSSHYLQGGWDFWKIIEGGSRFSCKNRGKPIYGVVYRRGWALLFINDVQIL